MHRVVMAPRAMPQERIDRLREAFDALQQDPAYRAAMAQMGENIEYMSGAEYEVVRIAQGREYGDLAAAIAAL
jgi:tripartite-type tricarboxylate transporter receptor subunit TctC